jgi:peroxiredoxin
MIASLCLLTCVVSMAQPPSGSSALVPPTQRPVAGARGSWLLSPQLAPGQEFTYSGLFKEEFSGTRVSHETVYRLENTLLVTDPGKVAVLTVLKWQAPPGKSDEPAARPASVRLEILQVDRLGRARMASGMPAHVALDGPPTLESGAFIEFPPGSVVQDRPWETLEDGRPPRFWHAVGTESVRSTSCLKIVSAQKSENWDSPRADGAAWRRTDTVWVNPQIGLAYRVERVVELREPAHETPTRKLKVTYELVSRVSYPERGNLFSDRRQEIVKTLTYLDEAKPYLRQPVLNRKQLEVILKKIELHIKNQAPNPPYRQALLQAQRRLQGALNGDAPVESVEATPATAQPAAVGQRAPDFLVTDLISKQSLRLYKIIGRPVLMVFYNPATDTGRKVLQFTQQVSEKHRPGLSVLALAVTDDVEQARKQYEEMRLPFHVLDGRGLHRTFDVTATPRLVLLDAEGVVRAMYTGWGRQTPDEVSEELHRWLPK